MNGCRYYFYPAAQKDLEPLPSGSHVWALFHVSGHHYLGLYPSRISALVAAQKNSFPTEVVHYTVGREPRNNLVFFVEEVADVAVPVR